MQKRWAVVIAWALITLCGCAQELDPALETAAVDAADAWLQMVDAGDFEGSWQASSDFFKSSVAKEEWVKTMNAVRTPMGQVISRKVTATDYRTMLPKALKGRYLIIEYDTSFANGSSGGESITQVMEGDGAWRVGGYHLK